MRKLASIQRILSISPIPNADSIEVAKILGWDVVVKKGEYNVEDLVVYVEVDSILPESKEEFEFMRPRNFKVKTIKLRKQISQGIIFPLSILPKNFQYYEDQDVTEILGITKYEPELPANLKGNTKSAYRYKYSWLPQWFYNVARKILTQKQFKELLCYYSGTGFPSFIPKTDETRVQVLQRLLTKYKGTQCYITEKLDGSSITCYLKDGEFGVCSRNVDLKEEAGNTFWDTVRAMDIEAKMRECFGDNCDIALQGELVGEGIQGNKLKIKGHTIRFFNVFNIKAQSYYGYKDFITFISEMSLETVPILNDNFELGDDIGLLVESAKGNSCVCPSAKREGIVIRPVSEVEEVDEARGYLVRNRLSFKAINPEFLLKYDE